MKKFVLTTNSESGDHYTYLIEHSKKPTYAELYLYLNINGSDIGYEHIIDIQEIINFGKIEKPTEKQLIDFYCTVEDLKFLRKEKGYFIFYNGLTELGITEKQLLKRIKE